MRPHDTRPWYARWWAIAAAVLMVAALGSQIGAGQSPASQQTVTRDATTQAEGGLDPATHQAPRSGQAAAGASGREAPGGASRPASGAEWSRILDKGRVSCEPPESIWATAPDGAERVVNGMILGEGYPEIDPMWLHNPDIPSGVTVDIDPLIDSGLQLC